MADLWERVKKTANELYTTASEMAVDGVHIGVRKLDEVNLRRDLSREFAGLGGRTYQLLERGQADQLTNDATVKHHLARLRELESRLEEKEREIQEIRARSAAASEQTSDDTPAPEGQPPSVTGPTSETPSDDETDPSRV